VLLQVFHVSQMTSPPETVNIPLHQEWWFRILVTALLAALVQLWAKYVNDFRDTSGIGSTKDAASTRDERQERLRYSRLIDQDGSAHDLSLTEEESVERQRKGRDAMPFDEDEPTKNDDVEVTLDSGEGPALEECAVDESTKTSSNQGDPKIDPSPSSTTETSGADASASDAGLGTSCSEAPAAEAQQESPPDQAENPLDITVSNQQPRLKTSFLTDAHPGLDAFWYWWDVNTSLFRIYTLARNDGVDVSPPYNPSSRRGVTPVALKVTNGTKLDLLVYWVDFKGKYVPKGKIQPGRTWYQSTWIDHPWVFCRADNDQTILYYIPYRVIPTTEKEPTVDPDDPDIGVHRFTIHPPSNKSPDDTDPTTGAPLWRCQVADPVLPYPAKNFFLTPEIAVAWTLLHCHRMSHTMNVEWNALIKYLSNVVHHPDEAKYRRLRLANPKFAPVWNSPLQGLLLAVGFVEHHEYAHLGRQDGPLSRERVQDVAQLVYHLEQWKDYHETADGSLPPQPEGADGYGREGYGRAGLNLT
jgi:PUB domain/VHL beta domain